MGKQTGIVPKNVQRAMRREYGEGASCRELGKKYGVGEMTAWRVVNGEGVYAAEKVRESEEKAPTDAGEVRESLERLQSKLAEVPGANPKKKLSEKEREVIERYYKPGER